MVSIDVRASGNKQILRITNYVLENSLYRPRLRRSTSSLLRADTLSSSHEAFEAVTEEILPSLAFNVDLKGIGISLINRRVVEVVYLSMENLKFESSISAVARSINLSCGSLQIDNQLYDATYPVVLQPTPIAKEANDVAALPTIQGSIIWLNDRGQTCFLTTSRVLTWFSEHGVLFIKYCSILLQALTIEVDEDFLFAMYDLSQIKGTSWEEGQEEYAFHSLIKL